MIRLLQNIPNILGKPTNNSCLSPNLSQGKRRSLVNQMHKPMAFWGIILEVVPCRSNRYLLTTMISKILSQWTSSIRMLDICIVRSKEMMRITLQRLRKDRKNLVLQRLNLMLPIRLLQLMLLIKPPLKLQQQRKLMKMLSGTESSTHSMVLFTKTMAQAGTPAMVFKLEESTSIWKSRTKGANITIKRWDTCKKHKNRRMNRTTAMLLKMSMKKRNKKKLISKPLKRKQNKTISMALFTTLKAEGSDWMVPKSRV